ncbi:MAG TPA: hypothetical protein VEY07_08495 [Thermoplasmata archaeon]|nr:hypothetical protein [Thermoplasmata archaeon]
MKWRLVGRLLRAASLVKREPERSALRSLGQELASLDAPQPPRASR